MVEDEEDGVAGGQPLDHPWMADYPADTGGGEVDEPEQHHRAEQREDPAGAEPLYDEEPGDDHRGHWNHDVAQVRGDDLDALHRGEHADRRRDQGVAVEQGHPEDPDHHEDGGLLGPIRVEPSRERGQGHDSALAVVVGPDQDPDVLDRDDEGGRPEDHRDDAVDVAHRRADRAVVDREYRLQRVQRTGADVAEHDPE